MKIPVNGHTVLGPCAECGQIPNVVNDSWNKNKSIVVICQETLNYIKNPINKLWSSKTITPPCQIIFGRTPKESIIKWNHVSEDFYKRGKHVWKGTIMIF